MFASFCVVVARRKFAATAARHDHALAFESIQIATKGNLIRERMTLNHSYLLTSTCFCLCFVHNISAPSALCPPPDPCVWWVALLVLFAALHLCYSPRPVGTCMRVSLPLISWNFFHSLPAPSSSCQWFNGLRRFGDLRRRLVRRCLPRQRPAHGGEGQMGVPPGDGGERRRSHQVTRRSLRSICSVACCPCCVQRRALLVIEHGVIRPT